MPFAGKEGGVAFFLQGFGDRHFLQVHPVVEGSGVKASATPAAEEIGGVLAGGVSSRLYAEAGRGANRIGGITVGEFHSGFGQAVGVRGFVKTFGVVGADVHVAQVVHQKEGVARTLLGGQVAQRAKAG